MPNLDDIINGNTNADDVVHSNGIGSVAGGGSAGGLSMEQRKKLLNQPRVVGDYKYSRLGRQGSSLKARTAAQQSGRAYDASTDSFVDEAVTSNRQQGGIKNDTQVDKSIEKRQHFIEPPSRGYDKFA